MVYSREGWVSWWDTGETYRFPLGGGHVIRYHPVLLDSRCTGVKERERLDDAPRKRPDLRHS